MRPIKTLTMMNKRDMQKDKKEINEKADNIRMLTSFYDIVFKLG